jgi:hypothetical protein
MTKKTTTVLLLFFCLTLFRFVCFSKNNFNANTYDEWSTLRRAWVHVVPYGSAYEGTFPTDQSLLGSDSAHKVDRSQWGMKNPQRMSPTFVQSYRHFTGIVDSGVVYTKQIEWRFFELRFCPQTCLSVSRIPWKFHLNRMFPSRDIKVPKNRILPFDSLVIYTTLKSKIAIKCL